MSDRCNECVECLKETVTELDELISTMRVELRKKNNQIESLKSEIEDLRVDLISAERGY